MKNKLLFLVFSFLLFVIVLSQTILAEDFIGHMEEDAVSVYDLEGNYVFGTAMGLTKGDRYISEDNQEYLVEEVNGKRAIAKSLGKVDLLAGIGLETNVLPPLAVGGKKLIGIYHTHNDESYKPGPTNINGQGEIFDVGVILKKFLEEKGIRVIQSKNLHLPHDGAAYERSKATAIDLAKQRPDAIFDVHRDAIPKAEEYLKTVNNKKISQIRLVVGRQNPNKKANDQFARQFKAVADKQYPGLIKGIFYGRGAYNQEISPRSLLFEFGTHVTTKKEAEKSAVMLADSINLLLYGGKGSQPSTDIKTGENKSSLTTIAWIVGILVIGIIIYLFINEGSWEGVVNRIKFFFSRKVINRKDRK